MLNIRTRSTDIPLGDIPDLYKGREAKDAVWRVPEHQRDYVWKPHMQSRLIDSIMLTYPIPPIMLHEHTRGSFDIEDGQQRVETIFLYMQNKFRWNRGPKDEVYYNHPTEASMTESERQRFNLQRLFVIEFANATTDEIAEIFERLNSGKSLNDNDKLWNRKDTPLLQFVKETIFGTHLARIQAIFTDKIYWNAKNLSNAVGLIAGCLYGRDEITTSFTRLCKHLNVEIGPEARDRCIRRLDRLLSLYESVDKDSPYPAQKLLGGKTPSGKLRYVTALTKMKEQFALGKFSAYYLYDLINGDGERIDSRDHMWQLFLMKLRNAEYYKYDNKLKGDGGGANNINLAKLEAGIKLFDEYAKDNFEELGEGDKDDGEDDDESV
jgi:hypothetical protein